MPTVQGRPTGQETAMRRLALARAAGGVLAASPGLSRVHGRQPIPAAVSGELPSNRRDRHPQRNPLPAPVPRTTGPPADRQTLRPLPKDGKATAGLSLTTVRVPAQLGADTHIRTARSSRKDGMACFPSP